MSIAREEIIDGLRALGLSAGDVVVVHSSLSNIGFVEGGAETVVEAFLELLGTEGTLVVPTFTNASENSPFHPDRTSSETGAITEAVRVRDDATRTTHPTHSVAAVGDDAESITASHDPLNPLGIDSPIHKVARYGGFIVLLGVTHVANSSIHVAEQLAGVPYRDQTQQSIVIDGGETNRVETNAAHCSLGFNKVNSLLHGAEFVHEGRIGQATVQVINGTPFLNRVRKALEQEPGLLLCDDPECERCQYARGEVWDG